MDIIYHLLGGKLQTIHDLLDSRFDLADPEHDQVINHPITQLAQSFIPLFKLSNLFFKKVSSVFRLKIRSANFTEMSSYHLDLLVKSVGIISSCLRELMEQLEEAANQKLEFPQILQPNKCRTSPKALVSRSEPLTALGSLELGWNKCSMDSQSEGGRWRATPQGVGTLRAPVSVTPRKSKKTKVLADMAEPDTLASHELRHQAEFARKVFVRLAGYDYSLGLVNAPSNILTDRLRSKKDLLAQLCSTLLPLLRQQIAGLSEALWAPNTLQEKPDLVVMLVLEIQPKLELTLDRIICDINDIIPGPVPEPKQTEDQHFKQFKSYRIFGLVNSIRKEMQSELAAFFADCGDIIHQIPTPLEERYIHSRSSLPDDTLRSIDAAIRWSEGSELSLNRSYLSSNYRSCFSKR
ncbi:hypothetical protein PTTG_26641 [Puccinia triticina 1-1 BBBD Race 1]|uniref:Uncharacterized protein n=1 Tax=Puccinia triticina (isolate 1-1 / race 1 (BBBD)) TaxID=630390 RepID=A0A180GRS0_PUCT1|nr:hypothetical protein PTTG_26641 [Puccinia triticina 1-1 BBBD Race 1]